MSQLSAEQHRGVVAGATERAGHSVVLQATFDIPKGDPQKRSKNWTLRLEWFHSSLTRRVADEGSVQKCGQLSLQRVGRYGLFVQLH